MDKFKLAKLPQEILEEIQALEQKLSGVCLVAVERAEAMFAVEAKIDRNIWAPVDQIYPEIEELKSYYHTREDAALAKGALKNLLRSPAFSNLAKRPIRVREIG